MSCSDPDPQTQNKSWVLGPSESTPIARKPSDNPHPDLTRQFCAGAVHHKPAILSRARHIYSLQGPRSQGLLILYPEGPSTQYLRFLVPKTRRLMVFGTRERNCWVLEPPNYILKYMSCLRFQGSFHLGEPI